MNDIEWVDMLWECFKFSRLEMADDINRMQSLQSTHDNVIDDALWPTISKIPIATAWATVEEALGPALDYLLPPQPFIKLFASDKVDDEVLQKVQWALHLMLVYRMKLRHAMHRSVKDCYKVGLGYGIVEPITVTPPAVFEIMAGKNKTNMMGRGKPMRSLRFRYVSPGRVVVYPSGVDFNGDDATPYAFLLDTIPEASFRKMFDDAPRDGVEVLLKGDPDEMIDEARTQGFSGENTFLDFLEKMSGRKSYARGRGATKKNVPVLVPVLKCFAKDEGRHTWLFCGKKRRIIWDKQDTYDTARNPLIKFDAWLDSDRWCGMSQPEADERTAWAKNVWFNLLYDLATWSVKRPLLYDSTAMDDPPEFGPRGSVGIPGNVNNTAKFMEPPGIDQGSLMIGAEIDKIHNGITGQRDFTQRNFTRGGSMAFQDLLQSSNGRERMRHALLQTGGFESIVWQTLIYMQTLGSGMDLTFKRPAYNQKEGREYVESFSITEDDMKHAFDVVLDLDAKHRLGAMDQQMKLQLYGMKKDSPFIDQWEATEDLFFDENTMNRQRLPREVAQQKQKEREAAEVEGMRAGIAKKQGQVPMQPALAGAMEGGAV